MSKRTAAAVRRRRAPAADPVAALAARVDACCERDAAAWHELRGNVIELAELTHAGMEAQNRQLRELAFAVLVVGVVALLAYLATEDLTAEIISNG